MKISFHGAAQIMTGSNYLIETKDAKILVDCGLFQGGAEMERKNLEPFPYRPDSIDAVILTHAHLDHTGRLPMLSRDGFKGPIFATRSTIALAQIVTEDSIHILKERAEREKGVSVPLYYDFEHLDVCWRCAREKSYGERFAVAPGIEAIFRDAGHILGSAIVELFVQENGKETKIVFSGDLGNQPTPFLQPTETIEQADIVVIESTYGDRVHEDKGERRTKLKLAVEKSISRGGVMMIPTFAIERSQEILYELNSLIEGDLIGKVPIFLDSPMAIRATDVYRNNSEHFNSEALKKLSGGDDIFSFPGLKLTTTVDESKAINNIPSPKIIIAGSGMSTGGRILHHELRYLPDKNSTILFIGYQVEGTLGRRIFDGAGEVTIWGERVPVRCYIEAIGGYSAHADQPGLIRWLSAFVKKPSKVFVTHGEKNPALILAEKIKSELKFDVHVPKLGETVVV